MPALTIATRGSALARWQADHVVALLAAAEAEGGSPPATELVVIETHADRRLDIPIWELGGKGVFVKEVQAAVLDGRARLAVHSGKDLPSETHPDLVIGAVPERADPRDVLVGGTLATLAPGAPIATGSIRRRVQLADRRPDLTFTGLRGNIATRLDRIPAGGAIVMAAAALDRLGLHERLAEEGVAVEVLEASVLLPQVAQGALAVECRADDDEALALLAAIEHAPSRTTFDAERGFLAELGGDCDLPAGAHATANGDGLHLDALLSSPDGHVLLRTSVATPGPVGEPDTLGRSAARRLLDESGGAALLLDA